MRIEDVLIVEIRLDITQRGITADPDVAALADPGNVDIEVEVRRGIAIERIFLCQLVTEYALHRDFPVIGAIQIDDTEAPIDMVRLHGVRYALDVQHRLVELGCVRVEVIAGWGVAVRAA